MSLTLALVVFVSSQDSSRLRRCVASEAAALADLLKTASRNAAAVGERLHASLVKRPCPLRRALTHFLLEFGSAFTASCSGFCAADCRCSPHQGAAFAAEALETALSLERLIADAGGDGGTDVSLSEKIKVGRISGSGQSTNRRARAVLRCVQRK